MLMGAFPSWRVLAARSHLATALRFIQYKMLSPVYTMLSVMSITKNNRMIFWHNKTYGVGYASLL